MRESDTYKVLSWVKPSSDGSDPRRFGFPVSSLHAAHEQHRHTLSLIASLGLGGCWHQRITVTNSPERMYVWFPVEIETHNVVSVVMFPICRGRLPAIDALLRVLCRCHHSVYFLSVDQYQQRGAIRLFLSMHDINHSLWPSWIVKSNNTPNLGTQLTICASSLSTKN